MVSANRVIKRLLAHKYECQDIDGNSSRARNVDHSYSGEEESAQKYSD